MSHDKLKVWVVQQGEAHEGGSVCGLFWNKEDAIKCALAQRACFEPWTPMKDEHLAWESGCDYVKVEEIEVL